MTITTTIVTTAGGVRIVTDRNEAWFIQGDRIRWIPAQEMMRNPDRIVNALAKTGYTLPSGFTGTELTHEVLLAIIKKRLIPIEKRPRRHGNKKLSPTEILTTIKQEATVAKRQVMPEDISAIFKKVRIGGKIPSLETFQTEAQSRFPSKNTKA